MSDAQPPPPPSDGSPPPPPPSGEQPAGGQATVELGRRFGARILDFVIVYIPMWIVLAVLPGLSAGEFVGQVLIAIVLLAYFIHFEGTTGQTPGKGILDMKVVAESGELSYERAFRRNAWGALGILSPIPLLGVLFGLAGLAIAIYIAVTINGDPRNQGWHDKLAGTLVVQSA